MSAPLRLLLPAAILCAVSFPVDGSEPAASSDAARVAYLSAAALQNREAWDLATEEWQALLAAHPQDPLALKGRYYLAVCQLKSDRWPEAEKTLRDVIASKADAATVSLARWDLGQGTFESARKKPSAEAYSAAATRLREFLDSGATAPQAADALHLLGESLWQTGKRDDAIAAWQRCVKDHPDAKRLPEVLYALGVGQAETKRPADAAATFARFMEKFPGHPLATDVALWRADAVTAAGRTDDAEKLLVPLAATKGPRAADALDRLGRLRAQRKDWAGAAEAHSRVAALFADAPRGVQASVAAARALVEAGRPDEARSILEKAAATKFPDAAEAAHRLAVLELAARKPDRALDVATRMLDSLTSRPGVDPAVAARLELDRADALWEIPSRRTDAAAAYAALADKNPESPVAASALSMAAIAALEARKPDEALARADTFLTRHAKAAPDLVLDVRGLRAEALLALGRRADAAAAWRDLIAAEPKSPRRPTWLARQAAVLAADRQWKPAHEAAAAAAVGLSGEARAETVLLGATALIELGRAAEAAKILVALEKEQPAWSRRTEVSLLAVRALRDAGDKPAALAMAERLVAAAPSGPGSDAAWYRVGQLRRDAGNLDGAVDAFTKAAVADPRGPRAAAALLAVGWCHESQKRLPEAIKAWTEVIDRGGDPESAASALLARADARLRGGDFASGQADAERLISAARGGKGPRDPAALAEARLIQGLCLASQKKPAQAAAAFQSLLEEQPKSAAAERALFELGVTQAVEGKSAEALATFRTFVDRHPRSRHAAEAWLEIGEACWGAKAWDDAVKAYAASVAAAGSAAPLVAEQATHKLGWTHVMRKDHAAAAEAFTAQVRNFPQGAFAGDGQAMLGESLLTLDRVADADRAFAAALADPPRFSSAELRDATFLRAAEAAARQEKWAESLALAERLIAASPRSPRLAQARYAAAWARQNLGRLDEALAGYRAVAEADRSETAARARLMEGEVLFEQGSHKEAIKAFFKAAYGFGEQRAPAAFHPWQAQATFEAARCFEVLRQPDQARRLYAELVERYPASEHVATARRRLDALGPAPAAATPAP